jgi:hypothetical protein
MRKRVITLLVSLAAACGGPPGPRPAAPTASASEVLTQLRAVARSLDELAGRASGSADLEALPPWVVSGPYGRLDPAAAPADIDALRRIARGDHPPRIRALACMWLATAGQLDDLGLLDALLVDHSAAGSFPSVTITQHV